MKTMENFFIQGLLLSLTTQLVWTLAVNNDETRSQVPTSQGIVGTLYRSAALKASDKELIDPPGSSRGQRCVRCGTGSGYGAGYGGGVGYGTGYGNYADRDYYRGREDPQYYGGRDPYYGSTYGNYRDRNWYYQPESRYPDSRYYGYNRYDDRYYGRTSQTEYDPYNYNSYRGNGYDNLNPSYYEAMRDRFQRERSYGYDQYYDRSYDRPYRGYYDNRNFRPYDETYSTSYGGRPQSLGSSYLFERTDDDANTGTGLNPPATSDTKKPESANLEMKSE